MTRWVLSIAALAAVLSLGDGPRASASPTYQWVEIPDLGGHYVIPGAIAPNDSTIVGFATSAASDGQGFLWTPDGGTENILPSGSVDGILLAINSSDVAVGHVEPLGSVAGYHPVRYVPGGPREDLTGLGGPSEVRDINDAGQMAGQGQIASPGRTHAAFWDTDGTPTDLGTLGPHDNGSYAMFISNSGEVVGRSDLPAGPHAFTWTQASGMVDVNPLAGLTADVLTTPQFANNAGQILLDTDSAFSRLYTPGHGTAVVKPPHPTWGYGYRAMGEGGEIVGYEFDGAGTSLPFEWRPGTGAIDIPIPAGDTGMAVDISSAGVVVGVYRPPGGGDGAFEWSPSLGFVDLGPLPDGFTFNGDGTLINDAGTVVVTGSDHQGNAHAFVRLLADGDVTAPTVSSTNDGAAYTIGDAVTADYTCDDLGGSGLASCAGTVANGAALDTSAAGTFSYDVTAADNAGNHGTATFTYTVHPSDQVSQTVGPGGTATTDTGDPGPSADDPVATSVTVPGGGSVTIQEGVGAAPPLGFDAIGQGVQITAPDATVGDPLIVSISIDRSLLPGGTDETNAEIFRDGVQALPCTGPGASPDPCVESRIRTPAGDGFTAITLTVRTSHASTWTTGVQRSYPFTGFFGPVKNTQLNVMPAGRGVKLNFSVGGNRGLNILAPGSPQVVSETCPSMKLHTVATTTLPKKSKMTYNAAKDRYGYVWKTPATAGCYSITLTLTDASSHTLHFKLS